jgi:hypothetical protein
MDDDQFVQRLQNKIQRSTGQRVDLRIDQNDADQLQVELDGEVPLVVLGSNIFNYAGFARMCVEYAVASIRQHRHIDMLEFHLLLARN